MTVAPHGAILITDRRSVSYPSGADGPGPDRPAHPHENHEAHMPRISKPAPQRRAEILDTARRLFTTRGFQSTSVEDILTEVGIAKGTLYYHFSSKEEILRALIARTADGIADRARAIAEGRQPAVPKLLAIAAAARVDEPELELAEELHAPGNAEFHVLTIVETVRRLTPISPASSSRASPRGSSPPSTPARRSRSS